MKEDKQSAWARSIPLREQKEIVKRLLHYARPYAWQFLLAIVCTLFLSVINILLPKILQTYMDKYLTHLSATNQIIFFFVLIYLAATVMKAFVWFWQGFLFSKASVNTLQHVRVALFEKLHTLGMRYFDQTPAGSIVSRVTNDTESLFEFWNVFLTMLTAIFSLSASLVAMFRVNPSLAVFFLWFLPVLLLIIWYYQKFSSKVYRQMREKLSQLNTKLNESISGMSIIQQFRQEERLEQDFDDTNEAYLRTRFAMIRTNSLLLAPIINLLVAIGISFALGYFGKRSLSRPVEVGMVYLFISYVRTMFQPMIRMMDSLSVFQDGMVAGSRIIKILDNQELTPKQKEQANATITEGKIEFKQVSFSYDGEHEVLKDISFVANPGETVALVGHTGSGKSSIINVLMRFYEFSTGEILIDGRDIREYPMEELRDKMGLVLQDAFMFYGDIAGNIRMLNTDITDEEIQKAAEFVQADEFIQTLPGGYHAKVIERGSSYSSGQRQLISFARTIVTDPKILVLDEATASIDTETESLIQEGLAKMRKGRTTIAIAHRLSTIRDANLILVLERGRIVERGNHDELLAQKGLYYNMYQLQKSQQDS